MSLLEMYPEYASIIEEYPNYMSKEQLRLICHISKKTALLLLKNGYIPFVSSGKRTHTYKIATADVLNYLRERDIIPEKYVQPINSYSKGKTPLRLDAEFENWNPVESLESLDTYPDVLSVHQVAFLLRIKDDTINRWIKEKCLKAFSKQNKNHIPKLALIEFLQSPQYICKISFFAADTISLSSLRV